MSGLGRQLCSALLILFMGAAAAPVLGQDADAADLWADFNHYVLIARPDLASDAGEALLEAAEGQALLEVVEASDYRDYGPVLDRAARLDAVSEVAEALRERLHRAQLDAARDADRISRSIDRLSEGRRAYANAVERLQAAGQHAAPQLLEALRDDQRTGEHPRILSAMRAVGRPMAYPLSEALPRLESSRVQRQAAQVLAEIRSPQAMASIKEVLEREDLSTETRRVLQRAYDELREAAGHREERRAANLYHNLGRTFYRNGTRGEPVAGYDEAEDVGVIWSYRPRSGLVATNVPAAIHADVRAMRSARRALRLNPGLDRALSLHLMANMRRANRLPEGEEDPSYPGRMREPSFYARIAGPDRLHEVLDQALQDADGALALDAIDVLKVTAGTDALVRRDAGRRPLLSALSYPDRRIRFRAAEALANARPERSFEDSHRVVPVLADAVRQREQRYAVLISESEQERNELGAELGDLGYEVIGGTSLGGLEEQIDRRPGIDLIVVSGDARQVRGLLRRTDEDYKLAATPVLAVVSPGAQARLREQVGEPERLRTVAEPESEAFPSAVEALEQAYAGEAIGSAEAREMSLRAMSILAELALLSEVFNVGDAQAALIETLEDEDEELGLSSSAVLRRLPSEGAQQAVAARALGSEGQFQRDLLADLAVSARHHGNRLETEQTEALQELVRQSTGETAVAAAEAYGALGLPTERAVELIEDDGGED